MREVRSKTRAAELPNTQRGRMLAGMLAAFNDDGYAGATVANVAARAGVSRRTFYQYFSDKDDCFLALYSEISGHLVEQIAHSVGNAAPERALQIVIRQLTEYAEANPLQARFLASDALAAGRRALQERGRTIGQITCQVQTAHANASAQTAVPDLPIQSVIGATQSLIAGRMRHGERRLTHLARELTHWLALYEQPIGKHRWSTPGRAELPEPCLQVSKATDELPPCPPFWARSAPPSREPAENHRWRILIASAESAVQSGYRASTVRAIMAGAGLRDPAFYDHFAEKRQAFEVLHELAFQRAMRVGAAAYFSARYWPERVWRCLLAISGFVVADPTIAHVGLIETHPLGPPAIQRVDESRHTFATLLRADSSNTRRLPDVTAAEAIGAAIFEIAHNQILHEHAEELPRYAYHAVYLALAPFLGVQAANRFVQRKVNDAERGSESGMQGKPS